MIQDFDSGNLPRMDNFGNTTTLRQMQESGFSSRISLLLNKVVDSDIPQQAIQGFQNLIKRQNTFYRMVKKA
jgi:hypothetical protein